MNYPWLNPIWKAFGKQLARMPHALILHGPTGLGKQAFALHLAQSLLCENQDYRDAHEGNPCGSCSSCHLFKLGNHLGFRLVMPEALMPEPDEAEVEEGGEEAASDGAKTKKAPSKIIKISQIRALESFFGLKMAEGSTRVVLISPAETLTVESGNALLKILEEPNPGTVFLLVTAHLEHVLPTIRSRAGRFAVCGIDLPAAQAWLTEQGVSNPEAHLHAAGGAPLAALEAAQGETFSAEHDALLDALSNPQGFDPVATASACEKAGAERVSLWLSQWVTDAINYRQCGKVRYYPKRFSAKSAPTQALQIKDLHRFYREVLYKRAVASHPLNAKLFCEDLLLDYVRMQRV